MSKFDRCIFISIAIGIWALAMTQVFKPEPVSAQYGFTHPKQPTKMWAPCPKFFIGTVTYPSDGGSGEDDKNCSYQMVVTYDDLIKHRKFFK